MVKSMLLGIMKSLLVKNDEIANSVGKNCKLRIEDLRHVAEMKGTKNLVLVEKDYFQELILYFLSKYSSLIFKGGSTLRKFWNGKRFSPDLDFVGDLPIEALDDLLVRFENWGYPARIGEIREYGDGNYTVKLVIRGIVYLYHNIVIDVFQTSPVTLTPQLKRLVSMFPDIPPFEMLVMAPVETMAEKVRALFSRERPQDLYDINFLLDITSIDWQMVREKLDYCALSYSLDELKRRINNMKRKWETDMLFLIPDETSFDEAKKRVLKAFIEEEIYD